MKNESHLIKDERSAGKYRYSRNVILKILPCFVLTYSFYPNNSSERNTKIIKINKKAEKITVRIVLEETYPEQKFIFIVNTILWPMRIFKILILT